jgi:hypothetical protein
MTELNCSLRSRQIALEADGVVVAHRRKTCPLAPPRSIGARSGLNCSLRSRQIALEADGVVVAHRRKTCPLAPPPSIGARSKRTT